jgi:lipoprotein signal peptidase
MRWTVFSVADSEIALGAGLMVLEILFRKACGHEGSSPKL